MASERPRSALSRTGIFARLRWKPGEKALRRCGRGAGPPIEAFYLGNFAGPSFVGQNHLAPYISGALGYDGHSCDPFEAACASSGSAFFHAVRQSAAGIYDVVMVTGVEKMTSQPTPRVAEILAGAGDRSAKCKAGATFPALFAMIARRHMHEFGTTREHLAAVAVKNHAQRREEPAGAHAEERSRWSRRWRANRSPSR